MADPRFVHLRIHSDFSMSHGLAKVHDLVKQAAILGMPAMALTDCCNVYGLVKFYQSAHAAGVKPIIGVECYLKNKLLTDKRCSLTLLAANNGGYQNLLHLISRTYLQGLEKGIPVVDQEWLETYKSGLILLSGGQQGDVGTLLLRGDQLLLDRCLTFYTTHFPRHYYLEISRIGQPDEADYIQAVVDLAQRSQLPLVATNPVCFITPEEFEAHEIRVAIHDGYTLSDPKRPKKYTAQQYLCSVEEMCKRFADLPEALINSVEIAKRCNVTLRLGEYFLPQFPTGTQSTAEYLVEQARTGLQKRLEKRFKDPYVHSANRPCYEQRLESELKLINQLGFPGYFLIVMEFIQWAKSHGIPVGPGRGSGAGSLVAYALQITDIDPLAFDLLFERFLNPERISLPDFDIDFCMDKRDRVIEHVMERYGRKAVAQIITFGTMAAKAAVRDVGRVLGHPYGFVDMIAKLIPPHLGITLEKAFQIEPQLQLLCERDEEVRTLIDHARKLEGVTRNASKHAAGVVIAPNQITDFAPLYCDSHGHHPVTQFDKRDVEAIGLLKFDFLGLRTLTIIHAALERINQRLQTVGEPPIDITAIALDDAQSFSLLKRAETTAVFQLESRGIRELIKRLQPDRFEDLIALVALYRPGPLQSGMVDNFIDRKQGREAIAYPDPNYQHSLLQPILEPTYGIILYQEQVMQIAQALAGYTLADADLLRRAMGKKDAAEMAEQRAVFEQGAKNRGIDGQLAIKIFDLVEKFAGYGFNKSHSAAYALVSYQTLWLKSHFPAEFMAAVMSADMDNTDKIVSLVEECRQMGLEILPPDINHSDYHFTVHASSTIRYGLGAIKGVGQGAIEAIVTARGQGGPFASLFALCLRTDLSRLNRRLLERLIMAGTLDSLQPHRAALISALDHHLKAAEQHKRVSLQGQTDLFTGHAPQQLECPLPLDLPAWTEQERLSYERLTVGCYLSGHPITQHRQELTHYTTHPLRALATAGVAGQVTVAGLAISARIVINKRGMRMGVVTLDDCSARLDAVLFSDKLQHYRQLLVKDHLLVATGTLTPDNFSGGHKMVIQTLIELSTLRAQRLYSIILLLTEDRIDERFYQRLKACLTPDCSPQGVLIQVEYQRTGARGRLQLGSEWRVTPTDRLLDTLYHLVGREQVVLKFDKDKA